MAVTTSSFNYGGYPGVPDPGFYTSTGKKFTGGFTYTTVASSTSEQALTFRNAAASGVEVRIVDFRASILTAVGYASASNGAIIRFYNILDLTGGSGTSATGINLLLGSASSIATYHTSATATATATVRLPITLQVSWDQGSGSLEFLNDNPIYVPAGTVLMAYVEGGPGVVTAVALEFTWIEV